MERKERSPKLAQEKAGGVLVDLSLSLFTSMPRWLLICLKHQKFLISKGGGSVKIHSLKVKTPLVPIPLTFTVRNLETSLNIPIPKWNAYKRPRDKCLFLVP